ncbi:MAG: tRNA (adenosine(37)-N6)-dimethylallyltransferase MiaA [Planctomycetota bacterium]
MSGADPLDPDPFDAGPLYFLVGPTACGKSAAALEICEQAGAELLSLDSMQVYRGLDVGTAKPSAADLRRVRHHLVDIADPGRRFDVQQFLEHAAAALVDVRDRGQGALFVGGTGLYLAALLRGMFQGPPVDEDLRARIEERAQRVGAAVLHAELAACDPAAAGRLHANDRRRVVRALEVFEQTGRPLSEWQAEWDQRPTQRERRARIVGLELSPADLDRRIALRVEAMLDAGWREEALALRAAGSLGPSAGQALGYAEVLAWAAGELERTEAARLIALRTRQFARRQRTWTRQFDVTWIPADAPNLVARALEHYHWGGATH